MKENLQKGFTLIELLVVIGIVGIVAAALITNMTGGIAAGQKLKCMANLKSLAQAVSSYTTSQSGDDDDAGIPTAGSFEYSRLSSDMETFFFYSSGAWVSWTPKGDKWPYKSTKSESQNMNPSTFVDKDAFNSITNGVLWSYVGKDASVYLCGTHKKVVEPTLGKRVYRSFVMNRFFGYNDLNTTPKYLRGVNMGSINQSGTASLRVLFAELPGQKGQTKTTFTTDEKDSVLEPDKNETLGFNHKVSNRWIANVAFADGHVDGVVQPEGANSKDLKDLTTQMCDGEELAIDIRKKML